MDTAEKETSYTLKELREKADSSDTVHTFITHVGINDIVNLDSDVNDLVRQMSDIVDILLGKSQKVILSLIASAEICFRT